MLRFIKILFRNYYVFYKNINASRIIGMALCCWFIFFLCLFIRVNSSLVNKPLIYIIIFLGLLACGIFSNYIDNENFYDDILENLNHYRFKHKILNILIPILFPIMPLLLLILLACL